MTATEPRTFAAAAGAVTAPVGAVESIVKRDRRRGGVARAVGAGDRVRRRRARSARPRRRCSTRTGHPPACVSVSALWVVQPAALKSGNVADAGPEPASVTVATRPKLPAALALKYTFPALRYAPVEPFAKASDTVGAVLSTSTLVTRRRREAQADVVGRDHAQVVRPVAERRRVPASRVRRRRVGGAQVRPRLRSGGRGLELRRCDARWPTSAESDVTVTVPARIRAARGRGDRAGRRGWRRRSPSRSSRSVSRPGMEDRGHSPHERPVAGTSEQLSAVIRIDAVRAAGGTPGRARGLAALDVVVDGSRSGRGRSGPAQLAVGPVTEIVGVARRAEGRGGRRGAAGAAVRPPAKSCDRDRTDAERDAREHEDAPGRACSRRRHLSVDAETCRPRPRAPRPLDPGYGLAV